MVFLVKRFAQMDGIWGVGFDFFYSLFQINPMVLFQLSIETME